MAKKCRIELIVETKLERTVFVGITLSHQVKGHKNKWQL